MRKTVVFLLALAMLLSGCGKKKLEQAPVDYTRTISALEEAWAAETGECKTLQRNLAQWYNVNLTSETPERGYEGAYDRILYYTGGVMGYVEIPSQGLVAPIFHGEVEGGFSHDPNSSFPIGGRGNHAVLYWDEEIFLAEGEQVILWIMGDQLVYVVGQRGEDQCTLICPERSWNCGRMVED